MSKKRIKYTSKFKAQVALEALREELSINELAAKHKVIPKNILNWKKQFLDNGQLIFEQSQTRESQEEALREKDSEIEDLHKTIGSLTVKSNWLEKKHRELGISMEGINDRH